MIKVAAPNMACRVLDRAIQAFGGQGVCQDTVLAQYVYPPLYLHTSIYHSYHMFGCDKGCA